MSNAEFLRSLLISPSAMFGFVTKKAAKNEFATLKVDISKSFFFDTAQRESTYTKMYCYHFENLASTIKEYKTLKMSEFFRMAPIIFNPSLALHNKDELLQLHKRDLELALGLSLGQMEKAEPLKYAKNVAVVEDQQTRMQKYVKRNKKLFNPSQLIVLDKVIEMPPSDILLI